MNKYTKNLGTIMSCKHRLVDSADVMVGTDSMPMYIYMSGEGVGTCVWYIVCSAVYDTYIVFSEFMDLHNYLIIPMAPQTIEKVMEINGVWCTINSRQLAMIDNDMHMECLPNCFVNYSVSRATHKPEDIAEAIGSFISITPPHSVEPHRLTNLLRYCKDVIHLVKIGKESEASEMLNEVIWDKMNEIAPYGTTFGAHEGDGSDFGFWEYEEDEEEVENEVQG